MKIAIAGSSGLIGTALVEQLRSDGHEVLRLVRREPKAASEIKWNPAIGEIDLTAERLAFSRAWASAKVKVFWTEEPLTIPEL